MLFSSTIQHGLLHFNVFLHTVWGPQESGHKTRCMDGLWGFIQGAWNLDRAQKRAHDLEHESRSIARIRTCSDELAHDHFRWAGHVAKKCTEADDHRWPSLLPGKVNINPWAKDLIHFAHRCRMLGFFTLQRFVFSLLLQMPTCGKHENNTKRKPAKQKQHNGTKTTWNAFRIYAGFINHKNCKRIFEKR